MAEETQSTTAFETTEVQTTSNKESGPAVTEEAAPVEEKEELKRVLLIAAHPDDPEFGCGGTMAKWAAAGKEITYVLLTSGDKGSRDPNLRPGQLATQREEEQRAAAKATGVKEVIFLRHPDGLLDNNLELRRQLVHLIRQQKPDILVAIDPWRHYQLHPDHRAAGQAALDAVWAAREWHIFGEQLHGDEEPWRTKEVYLFWTENVDYYEDITDHIATRVTALTHHASQVGTDHEKLDKRIRERAAKVGEAAECEYAEEFTLIKFR
ncbi:MAG: PIG-L family deacetylase [Caldilineaceae bacterium]|nr:PIG-L family deacetylase [Caldilineaceae bacterium]